MVDPQVAQARAQLDAVEDLFLNQMARANVFSSDPRRHTVTLRDGRTIGLNNHLNRRRKALRDWLRKWGPKLKRAGFQVTSSMYGFPKPIFIIEEIPLPVDPDDPAAQLAEEKSKKVFNPKRQRSKRLGKRPED